MLWVFAQRTKAEEQKKNTIQLTIYLAKVYELYYRALKIP